MRFCFSSGVRNHIRAWKLFRPVHFRLRLAVRLWLRHRDGLDGRPRGPQRRAAPLPVKIAFVAIWIGVAAFLTAKGGRFMRVRTDWRDLYVSNWRRAERIPFGQIAEVRQNLWTSGHPAVIRFREKSGFGDEIDFSPRRRLVFWRRHPIVDELRRRNGLAD